MNATDLIQRHARPAFLAWLALVVYGSLVPFEYREHTLDQAIEQFRHIAYLKLGVASRADWIANIVLYVPLAFLGCASILGARRPGPVQTLGLALVFALCGAIAAGVEFTQIFFAPRTVSLNDLIAESLGAFAGILLWVSGRRRVAWLLEGFTRGGRQSVAAMIAAYGLAYIALSLFPFDLLISTEELAWKFESGRQGWLIAGNCDDWLRCGARLAGDAAAIVPLGILLALLTPAMRLRQVFLVGLILGITLEVLQLLLASGTTQGLSAILRGVGLSAGVVVGQLLRRVGSTPIARLVWRAAPLAALPYLGLLAGLNGWFSGTWIPLEDALDRLADVRFLPFYYHYFSTEPAAMASLLANAAMYAPVGLVIWAHKIVRGRRTGRGLMMISAIAGVVLALPFELGKLMVPPKHPDFTDLLIAAGAAALTYALAGWIERTLGGVASNHPGPEPLPTSPKDSTTDRPARIITAPSITFAAGIAVILGLAQYPVAVPLLALVLLGYAIVLWRRPLLGFFAIPALLPALDLSPIAGRLLLDEFDLFVLVTLAVGYARLYRLPASPWPHRLLPIAMSLLWATWVVATVQGLWPMMTTGGIAASSHSPLEAWLVGKGMLWALLLTPLLRRVPSESRQAVQDYFLNGLVAGLAVVTLAVLWERHVFVGLGNFDNVFRVTGTFASMNTGGAYIEAFIAFSFPALAVWVLRQRSLLLKALGIGLAALAGYAMLVTYSRGGYAGLVAGLVVLIGALVSSNRSGGAHPLPGEGVAKAPLQAPSPWQGEGWDGGGDCQINAIASSYPHPNPPPARGRGLLRHPPRGEGTRPRSRLALAGLVIAVIAIAIPILSGGFAQQRLARAGQDLDIRLTHWARALDLMDDGVVTALLGMGFGRYPTAYLLLADVDTPPGSYSVFNDGGNPYLRLGAGESVFLDQWVNIKPDTPYRLSARVRQPVGASPLSIPLCEKALLYSFACAWHQLGVAKPTGSWETITIRIDSGELGRGGRWPHPPVKLSLYNPGAEYLDVDDVSLTTTGGEELLANGDFSDGVERWLFVTDQRLGWHIDQQWLETYFAQGLLGVLAVIVLLVAVTAVLWPGMRGGEPRAAAFAAALVAFLTVGLLGSTVDTARISMLFYMAALGAPLMMKHRSHKTRRITGRPPSTLP